MTTTKWKAQDITAGKNLVRFQPLKFGAEGEPTGTVQVCCAATGRRLPWNQAAREGWVADTNAPAFSRYLSPCAIPVDKPQIP